MPRCHCHTVLGEATPEEWARVQRRNQSFASSWSPMQIDEPDFALASFLLSVLGARRQQPIDLALRKSEAGADLDRSFVAIS